jgi:hypothetical protein
MSKNLIGWIVFGVVVLLLFLDVIGCFNGCCGFQKMQDGFFCNLHDFLMNIKR